ncbi:hypothetical protein NPIL_65181 [Nephila pilipes]|uniref:Uncharacterized protein n=1 Tax=Nephila pilipes TaxID=299642 RepID=A0A8X6KQT3_NEPPI|nr:hypothetical protein NPIL_65181 [Nephila pilipes]
METDDPAKECLLEQPSCCSLCNKNHEHILADLMRIGPLQDEPLVPSRLEPTTLLEPCVNEYATMNTCLLMPSGGREFS